MMDCVNENHEPNIEDIIPQPRGIMLDQDIMEKIVLTMKVKRKQIATEITENTENN